MKKSLLILTSIIGISLIIYALVKPMSLQYTAKLDGVVSAEPPIILIHGYNHNSNFWDGIHLIDQLATKNHILIGDFYQDDQFQLCLRDESLLKTNQSACYKLSLPANGTKDIRESAKLLEMVIKQVTERHQCDKVKLIAFSAGGVVSRDYLSKHLNDHKVESLTTISAPHLGSEHAWLAEGFQNIKSLTAKIESDQSGNALVKGTKYYSAKGMKTVTQKIQDWSNNAGVDIDSQCARMLARPQTGNYLHSLSSAPHPNDLKYHCIITEENIFNYDTNSLKNDFIKLKNGDLSHTELATTVMDLGRTGLGKLDKISEQFSAIKFRGDGVVSQFSQDLNNTDIFKSDHKLTATVTRLKTRHGGPEILSAIMEVIDLK